MTKAELIRKLAKRSGVPDQETKIFFELFLQKAATSLKRGEAVKLKGIGYFQLRQGVIKDSLSESNDNIIYSDLMVFFPIQNDEISSEESLIFNVPMPTVDAFSQVDSYFSLSIGKPVIPLEGVKETEYFSPPSSHELKKLIETKVDKLLQTAEVINQYIKGNEVLLIEPERPGNDQFEFEWIEKKEEDITSPEIERRITSELDPRSEFEHLAWDFGDDLSKQIEEEAIIDSANVNDTSALDLEEEINLEWNFGIPDEEDNYVRDQEEGGLDDEQVEDKLNHPDNHENKVEKEQPAADNFEQVKSITSVMEDSNESLKNILEPTLEEEFNESIDLKDEEENTGVDEVDLSETNSEAQEPVQHTEELNLIDKESVDNFAGLEEPLPEKIIVEKPPEIISVGASKYEKKKYYDKRNSSLVFIIALITILVVGAALYLFLKQGGLAVNKEKKQVLPASTPVIIERKYTVPVTYPYPPKETKESIKSGSDNEHESSALNSNNADAINADKNNDGGNIQKNEIIPSNKNIETPEIKDYIVKTGEHYVVQISSWQSELVAKKEAERFQSKGYRSFVEKANVIGKGTWYRVKVGNFKTLIEAQQFFKKNQ